MTANEPNLARAFGHVDSGGGIRTAVAQQGSLIATNRRFVRSAVNSLLGVPGVTFEYSCDGVTAGVRGDGLIRWDFDASIVFADPGVAHSWLVMKLPAGLVGIEVLFDCIINGGAAGDLKVYVSHAGFTGGTTTNAPGVGAGDLKIDVTNGFTNIPQGVNYAAHYSVIYAKDGTSIRLVATTDAAGNAVTSLFLAEKLFDAPAALARPYGFVWHGNDTLTDYSNVASSFHGYSGNTTAFAGKLEIDCGGANVITTTLATPFDLDGKLAIWPTLAFEPAGAGPLGLIPDLWWCLNDGTTHGKTIPAGAVRHFACFGAVILPWDSATDIGSGATDAHPIRAGFVPGSGTALISATPASGSSLGDFETGRWVPAVLVFDVPPGADPHAYAKIGAGGDERTVYRRDENGVLDFAPLFKTLSVATSVGDRWTLSILPLGGWWDAPIVWAGAFEEAI